jgi:drug/metabolite transporter (DMT)-like permease
LRNGNFIERHPVTVLALGASWISLAPILVKGIAAEGLGPTAIGFWRCLLGLVFWCVPFLMRRRLPRLPPQVALLCIATGALFAADLWVWHRSIVLAGAGLATILGNTQVFVTALLSAMVFKERPNRRFYIAALPAFTGVVLLVGIGGGVEFTPGYIRGILYGLATGLVYGAFIVTLRAAARRQPAGEGTLERLWWFTAAAAITLAIPWWFESAEMPAGPGVWTALAALALIAQTLGWWAIASALPRVNGALAGLMLLMQPVLASVWGAIGFGEAWTPLQVLGAAITLGAIYYGSRRST